MRLVDEDGRDLRIGDLPGNFGGTKARVERYRDRPEAHQGTEGDDVVGAVLAQERDVVSFGDTGVPKARCRLINRSIELLKCPAPPCKHERLHLGRERCPSPQPLGYRLASLVASPSCRAHHSRLAAKSSPKRR